MRYLTRRVRSLAKVVVPTAVAGALLALPAVAGATEITPDGADYTATAGVTTFIDNNGTTMNDVTCDASEATGSVPAAPLNELDDGAVNGPVDGLTFGSGSTTPPDCTALGGAVEADVDTEAGAGGYTLTALALAGTPDHAVAAFNIPDDKIEIDVGPGLCTITIPNNGPENGTDPDGSNPVAASAMGEFMNGTDNDTDPSTLSVRSQIPNTDGCDSLGVNLVSPGVFFADGTGGTTVYEVTNDAGPTADPIEINPSP